MVAPYRNLGAAAKVRLDMDESPARDPYSGSAAWQGLAVPAGQWQERAQRPPPVPASLRRSAGWVCTSRFLEAVCLSEEAHK